ncbi:serine/threonine protein phosphatase [Salipiger aestuarii]|uniref:Bis(5'nucleosyl)-tetraphosphatase ApaH n=1 Tax=Salipiger aestuarii TaxID=568098 RepID=A0A327YU32_9RHOB|nr:metallophosphoesterase family protein [Salipiger aestuarii]EIE50162.1 bis(5'nucleosyl)-tetraphosphatase, ApaH [Citreicella sp. 357]KAA8609944.1 serine/threonine protein phosphatase [Salipiger aestuarii]KAA8616268.1 serine/threonine protein phosphatase [Salipiger aestuarii]KAB2543204.1 serine/threonine protein phosphatase [Salipiger aestuarii]RAK21529.1 bis(5'nucleosyl)-tetraphosphatase ApaH [Salipiger aestuarii]
MQPIFAVGDIHGYLDQLHLALETIEREGGTGATTVFTGDFVDRGPDSRGVIETLMQGQAQGRPWVCLLGNHDRYLLRYLDFLAYQDRRTSRPLYYTDPPIGGDKTLESYGVDVDVRRWPEDIHADAHKAIPQAHLDWIAGLPLIYETQDQIFVHAGLRPGVALHDQEQSDLVWIREPFLSDTTDWGRVVVHGHTALQAPEAYVNRINLDGGAGYGRPLVPCVIEGRKGYALGANGRRAL